MATLAVDAPRAYELADLNDLPMVATDIIYEGAAVGDNGSGYARPLVSGDPFRGFATRQVDNTLGGAGAKRIQVQERGKVILSVTGVSAITDVDKWVYASDDATFNLTNGSPVGKITRWITGTTCVVKFDIDYNLDNLVQIVNPDDAEGAGNTIGPKAHYVDVQTAVNGVNDFVVLPALNSVPNGHEIILLCNAGGNFELRTPASSNEEINSEDCDGTKEYLCTSTQVVKIYKINNTIGWMAHGFSAIGAVVTAVVPD